MGWCSGTYIFDRICDELLETEVINKKEMLKILIETLWEHDWDCESDSEYYLHPTVMKAFDELGHNQFGD